MKLYECWYCLPNFKLPRSFMITPSAAKLMIFNTDPKPKSIKLEIFETWNKDLIFFLPNLKV